MLIASLNVFLALWTCFIALHSWFFPVSLFGIGPIHASVHGVALLGVAAVATFIQKRMQADKVARPLDDGPFLVGGLFAMLTLNTAIVGYVLWLLDTPTNREDAYWARMVIIYWIAPLAVIACAASSVLLWRLMFLRKIHLEQFSQQKHENRS
ncbi:MAG: hypothetical protein V4723_21890 [Pseudomonadota bacterium]